MQLLSRQPLNLVSGVLKRQRLKLKNNSQDPEPYLPTSWSGDPAAAYLNKILDFSKSTTG